MQKTHFLLAQVSHIALPFLGFASLLLFCSSLAYSQQYVIVDGKGGDRLTGHWRSATETHFEIEYYGQVLRLPLAEHTLSFTSDLGQVPSRTAVKYLRDGLYFLELELPERAEGRFELAMEEFPKYADAHYQLGLLYKANGDIEKALERFRSVVLIDAERFDLVPILREIGDATLASEDYTKAVDIYQMILTYYPEHAAVPELTYHTGFLLVEQLQDYTAGMPMLELAIKQYPNVPAHEKAFFLIGKLQVETEQQEKARYTLEGFITRYPESEWVDEARLTRAVVNLRLGKPAEAAIEATQVHERSADIALKERANRILDETAWTVYTTSDGIPHNQIQALARDLDGTWLWVGTPKGIMLIATSEDGWTPIETIAQHINTHSHTVPDVRAIAANPQELWIGTRHQGAIHYNKETNEIQTYSPPNSLPSGWVRDIKMDETETWFATDAGIVRHSRDTGERFDYNTRNSFIPTNDIHTLAITPTTVWAASSTGAIATFDRQAEYWEPYNSIETEEGTTIVKFDVAEEKLLFTWFNPKEKANGYFQADWNGINGQSVPLLIGIEEKTDLDNIYIAAVADTSPIAPETNEELPQETPNPVPPEQSTPELAPEIEETEEIGETGGTEETTEIIEGIAAIEEEAIEEVEIPPTPSTPLVLWIATNDDVYTYYTRSDMWQTTGTPRIITGKSTVQCIAVMNNRAWIGTTNGLVTISAQSLE